MNWRKPAITAALRLSGRSAIDNLNEIRRLQDLSRADLESYQHERLGELVAHAIETVPYYRDRFERAELFDEDSLRIDSFRELPVLEKQDLRDQGSALISDVPGPEMYENTSGGTTGEPVTFVQDQHYWDWNVANKLYYQSLAGKPLGGRELKLWGSERDVHEGRQSMKKRLRNFLYNRRLLNSFKMSESDMRSYVAEFNEFRPRTVWAYVESIHQLARFIEREGLDVYSPDGVITTAGTLYEPVRETIERVFNTTVYNQYGSREVGDMACECSEHEGLHVFAHTHFVEVVDEDGDPVAPGEEGYIVVTPLRNHSMPLIRYRIGDMAVQSRDGCSCGLPFPTLASVTGRVSDHFVTPNDDLIHGEYFTHLFYDRPGVEKFRVVQESIDHVRVLVEPLEDESSELDLDPIVARIDEIMGGDISVTVEYQSELAPSSSGKHRYTISKVESDK